MTVPTHLVLGSKICEAISKVSPLILDRRWFLYGNIYPDLSHYLFSAPHFAEQSLGFVNHRLTTLSEYRIDSDLLNPMYSMQLGILCHYVCDFFCHVHSPAFKGTTRKHLLYEVRQQALIMRHPRLIGRGTTPSLAPGEVFDDAHSIVGALAAAQQDYLLAPHRADNDLVLAVKMASMVLASVLNISLEASLKDARSAAAQLA